MNWTVFVPVVLALIGAASGAYAVLQNRRAGEHTLLGAAYQKVYDSRVEELKATLAEERAEHKAELTRVSNRYNRRIQALRKEIRSLSDRQDRLENGGPSL